MKGVEKVHSKIGFWAMLIGGAGLDGPDSTICTVIMIVGLIICWKESKKIDVATAK
jgi:hypothetical protein